MNELFSVHQGSTPLLVSVPHDGRRLPELIEKRMTPAGRDIPDTDWHAARLYDFAHEVGASMIVANYSRYVVDLNRPPDDAALYEGQISTGICPGKTFAGDDLYTDEGSVGAAESEERIDTFWSPYHQFIETKLFALRKQFGYALLWDAHSIPSQVPRLFNGELPVLNIGTNDGDSCSPAIADKVFGIAKSSGYDSVMNGRFKGGYITRHHGDPQNNVHAIQLEIAQRAYMEEDTREFDEAKANKLRNTLRSMLESFLVATKRQYE
jgi:N-formylglutamate amidohydrolase